MDGTMSDSIVSVEAALFATVQAAHRGAGPGLRLRRVHPLLRRRLRQARPPLPLPLPLDLPRLVEGGVTTPSAVASSRCLSHESDLGDRPSSPVRPAFVRRFATPLACVYPPSMDVSVVIEETEDTDAPVVEQWRRELAKKTHMFEARQMKTAATIDRLG